MIVHPRYTLPLYHNCHVLALFEVNCVFAVAAEEVGLDAPSCTALCCMFSNSWGPGE